MEAEEVCTLLHPRKSEGDARKRYLKLERAVAEYAFWEKAWKSAAAHYGRLVEATPDDLAALDRPLDGVRYATHEEFQEGLRAYVEGDLNRRHDPVHSPDLAVFDFPASSSASSESRVDAAARVCRLESSITWA